MKHSYALFKRFRFGLAGLMLWSLAATPSLNAGDGLRDKISGLAKSKGELKITDFGDFLAKLGIPQVSLNLFKGITIKTPTVIDAPKGFGGFSVTGSALFNNKEVKATVHVFDVADAPQGRIYAVELETPTGWKLTDMFPALKTKVLDELSLPEGKFVLASYKYKDPDLAMDVAEGLNFVAGLELTGPLSIFDKFAKAKMPRGLVFEAEKLQFQGILPRDLKLASFTATIPFRIGVDFTKIPKVPKSVSDVIQKIETGDFMVTVKPPPTPAFEIGTGLNIWLGKNPQPYKPRLDLMVEPTKLTADAKLEEKIELKWLALSNVGLQMEWDDTLIEAAIILGIPFTGVGFRGTLFLGKEGDKRASIDIAALARVQARGFGDLIFEGTANNLRVSDFIEYLVKLGGKPIPVKLPSIILKRVSVYGATSTATIADKLYKAGISVDADASIGDVDGGLKFKLDTDTKKIDGEGHLSPIKTKVIELTGVGTKGSYGLPDEKLTFDGPEVKLTLSGTQPERSRVLVHAMVKIPAIGLLEKLDMHLYAAGVEVFFETKIANLFDMTMLLQLNWAKPQDFLMRFFVTKGKEDFAKIIQKSISQAAAPLNAEIKRATAKIRRLRRQVTAKRRKCDKLKEDWWKILWPPDAKKAEKEYEACVGVALKELEKTLYQAERALVKFSKQALGAMGHLVNAINTVELKSASGQVSGVDLAQGKLPKVDIELYIKPLKKKISLKNLKFDLKNPVKSAESIGKGIVNIFK